jgi:hypothetical protein
MGGPGAANRPCIRVRNRSCRPTNAHISGALSSALPTECEEIAMDKTIEERRARARAANKRWYDTHRRKAIDAATAAYLRKAAK